MAKKTILTSDISGEEINGNAAKITIKIDGGKNVWVLDVTEAEARELGEKGTAQKQRGRRKATAAA